MGSNTDAATKPLPIVNPIICHSVITGGNFKQHNGDEHVHHYDNRQFHVQGAKGGFEILKEAVAPGAFHNSGERFDPPKCHPNTRVAVMEKIMDWILGQDVETRNALIMWLHGAAGSGKSAIAQSLAELCNAKGRLLASFFFGRSDPNRNHARSLFSTIAYHMALSIPQLRERLAAVGEYDPLIFTRSLSTQFLSLIVEPLEDLRASGVFNDLSSPRLIIIDGLDECLDRQVQREILAIIFHGIQQHRLPLIFLIASRPEHDISNKFNSHEMTGVVTRLPLDDACSSDLDIELFLRDKFTGLTTNHQFKRFIPTHWPGDSDIQYLVDKSSGQFIYASTVVKYVESRRHRPHHRLEVVLDIRRAERDLPFSELDALYRHILSSVDEIDQVLHVISFHLLRNMKVDTIERILSLEPGDIEILLCDLGSVILLHSENLHSELRILHASLSDFLCDQSRSKEFYIDMRLHRTEHIRKCFQLLTSATTFTDSSVDAAYYSAMMLICEQCHDCLPSAELRDDVLNFSIARIYEVASESRGFVYFNCHFLPTFFTFLKSGSHFEDAEYLYNRHLVSFCEVLRRHLKMYYADMRLSLTVALIKFLTDYPKQRGYYPLDFQCFSLFSLDTDFLLIDNGCLCLQSIHYYRNWDHFKLISECLEHPTLSGPFRLDGEKYASATLCVLTYLCDHSSAPQAVPPQHTKDEYITRRNTPWLWLKRTGRRGARDKTSFWHRKREKFPYNDFNHYWYNPGENHSLDQSLWSEKYYLGLEYLLYFLPRAGRLEKLIEFCTLHTFASRSQEFPNRSKKARRAIAEYLERMEPGGE